MTVMLDVMSPSVSRRRATPVRSITASSGHQPVMVDEILALLNPQPGDTVVDATLGGGGTSAALLERVLPGGRVWSMDRDPSAVEAARERFSAYGPAFSATVGSFSQLAQIAQGEQLTADVVIMDLGISSLQLDDPARGFSFQSEGPLDMRMDPSSGMTAAELVASYGEQELADLIYQYGDERHSRAIARAIVRRRSQRPITTTIDLASVCASAIPRRVWPKRIHPATRTFQALRIAVNDELEELRQGIQASAQILRPGGRFGIVFFHSLEGTIAKHSLHVLATDCVCPPELPVCTCAHRATLSLLNRHALKASEAEVARNPRSRSARLRAAVRLSP